jgi:hypothetical protein
MSRAFAMRSLSALSTVVATSPQQLCPTCEFGEPGIFRQVICRMAERRCHEHFRDSLEAIVLTGSLARDEATFVQDEGRCRLLGDAEFLLIFKVRTAMPSEASLKLLGENIEGSLASAGIVGEVHLSAAHQVYLRKLRPHIFAYELRECGLVVSGDPLILAQIPDFSASDIPLEDGWRLLSNRMVEQLEALEDLEQGEKILPPRILYRTIKLYLDMATSFLLFAGEYAPTYAERARRLQRVADSELPDDKARFDLRCFSERVSECTQWKLSSTDLNDFSNSVPVSELGFSWWEEAVGYAQQLWRRELTQLTRCEGQLSTEQLLQRWMRCQPLPRRLQGWLYVVRDQGWHRSWRNWPRWARLARRASPRYWIYEVTGAVFSQLPSLLKDTNRTQCPDADWEELRSFLPVVPELDQKQKLPDWRRLAVEIAWNYQKFLVETRS